MPLVPFRELMQDAERGNYAVGYFEGWNLESLLAVADAAEATRSPVILGFSGIYLPHPERRVADPLAVYAAMGTEVGRYLTVPQIVSVGRRCRGVGIANEARRPERRHHAGRRPDNRRGQRQFPRYSRYVRSSTATAPL